MRKRDPVQASRGTNVACSLNGSIWPSTTAGVPAALWGSARLWQEKGTRRSGSLDTAGWCSYLLSRPCVKFINRRQFEAGSLVLINSFTSEFTETKGGFPREERNIPVCWHKNVHGIVQEKLLYRKETEEIAWQSLQENTRSQGQAREVRKGDGASASSFQWTHTLSTKSKHARTHAR